MYIIFALTMSDGENYASEKEEENNNILVNLDEHDPPHGPVLKWDEFIFPKPIS
ncbi:MAG: hypothetical protein GY705_15895 [Bacteroidetes bacterium]|nr:hypothetical protein [Bacteroidota bacterium]